MRAAGQADDRAGGVLDLSCFRESNGGLFSCIEYPKMKIECKRTDMFDERGCHMTKRVITSCVSG